jgi:prolyl-tRNA synthetase
MNAMIQDEKGELKPLLMGCYGIGVSRILAAVAEVSHDDKGLIWPESVAPFHVALLLLDRNEESLRPMADGLASQLEAAGFEVFYDERDLRPGVKFADADLLGIPYQIVVGKRAKETGQVEVRRRSDRTEVKSAADQVIFALQNLRALAID